MSDQEAIAAAPAVGSCAASTPQVSPAEVAASVQAASASIVAGRSARSPRELLDAAGTALMQHPDTGPRLVRTAEHFPHVVNRLAAVWTEPERLLPQVQGLLLNDRPDRQGFPLAVIRELDELRLHYESRIAPVFRAMQSRPAAPRPALQDRPSARAPIGLRWRKALGRLFESVAPK